MGRTLIEFDLHSLGDPLSFEWCGGKLYVEAPGIDTNGISSMSAEEALELASFILVHLTKESK